MHAQMTGNQSGAEKDNRLLFREQWILLFSKSMMAATNFSQSGAEWRIQDGGAHESRPCWKTAHQPRRRTGIGLTDFHGDANHARVTQKNVMQLQTRYLQCPVVLNDRTPSDKRPWWRLRDLCPRHLYTFLFVPKHPGTVTGTNPRLAPLPSRSEE